MKPAMKRTDIAMILGLSASFAGGLYGLAILSFIAAVVCAFFLNIPDVVRDNENAARSAAE